MTKVPIDIVKIKMIRDYQEHLNIFANLDKIDHGLGKCRFKE